MGMGGRQQQKRDKALSTRDTIAVAADPLMQDANRQRRVKLALFCAVLVFSVAAFVSADYFYSAAVLGSAVSGGPHGFCFSRDPVRGFAFRPNCSCIRPWLGGSYEFKTDNLGFRDQRMREVPLTDPRPRILILGDSAPEGMTSWEDSFIGRIAATFPQYEFLNGSVEGYSPSNYLNTARIVIQEGVNFDEAIVFIDISDAQDEAAFSHDIDASGAVATVSRKVSKANAYSDLRLRINNNLLLTNDVFQFFEKALVRFGWYHLDLGHGGNEFDLERSAWTYRKVSDTEPYETGYAPLGLEGGIAREKAKMDVLWRELNRRNIPVSIVVDPWPAQLAHDTVDSRQVRIWRDWCAGKCKRFITLFPAFFAIKEQCPRTQPGCWYLSHFIFGDTHYNSAGDAVVAEVISKSLIEIPATKRQASGPGHAPAMGSAAPVLEASGLQGRPLNPEREMPLRALLYAGALLLGLFVFTKTHSSRVRQAALLIASYGLYLTWGTWFLAVLLASTAINFLVGRWLRRRASALVLWAGLGFNLGLLTIFKYLPGIAVSIPIASLHKFSQLALPLGISFWTFQAMSYLFDLYRGEELDPSFAEFALYMAFFPVTIAGPICRLPDMLPQFRSAEAPARADLGRGLSRIATGLLMTEIAQLLGRGITGGQGINGGFALANDWSGPDVWCLAFGYGLQIFFDFAGYSHIAIGAARMLGFTLPENFARPFASSTPSIFWTRWHMSLSFWIRDYVFVPLATLRRAEWWRKFCLLLALILFGLWHKATILFLLFGCYQGMLLILHRQAQQVQRRFNWQPSTKAWTTLCWLLTAGFISLGWIFFRADSLSQAGRMVSALLSPAGYVRHVLDASLYLIVLSVAMAYGAVLFAIHALDGYSERLGATELMSRSGMLAIIVRERLVWVTPIWATVAVLVLTIMTDQSRAANVFMYRLF
jgi:alginate O-acetyltransferase complex protein AlgI